MCCCRRDMVLEVRGVGCAGGWGKVILLVFATPTKNKEAPESGPTGRLSSLHQVRCKSDRLGRRPRRFTRRPPFIPNPQGVCMQDYYAILSISPSATPAEIKAAYHRLLLVSHPDKRLSEVAEDDIDIGLLKEAFRTLHTPELRAQYDKIRLSNGKQLGPRPAQVISLEDFEESNSRWTYACRCGGSYIITEEMLDAGQHLLGCASCSEVVWVGYEVAEVEEGEEQEQ